MSSDETPVDGNRESVLITSETVGRDRPNPGRIPGIPCFPGIENPRKDSEEFDMEVEPVCAPNAEVLEFEHEPEGEIVEHVEFKMICPLLDRVANVEVIWAPLLTWESLPESKSSEWIRHVTPLGNVIAIRHTI